jgi:hypothetical protein
MEGLASSSFFNRLPEETAGVNELTSCNVEEEELEVAGVILSLAFGVDNNDSLLFLREREAKKELRLELLVVVLFT